MQFAFTETPVRLTQARFEGRTMLVPEIDLKTYRFQAVVDWLEVTVTMGRATQHRYVKDVVDPVAGRSTFVEPVDPGPGEVTDTFKIRLQAPASTAVVVDVCREVFAQFGGTKTQVSGLEVSLDVYPRSVGEEERLRMFGLMARTLLPWTDVFQKKMWPRAQTEDHRRLIESDMKDDGYFAWLNPQRHAAARPIETVYLGRDQGDEMIRLQDKIADNRKDETATPLNQDDKRTRVEVTLLGGALSKMGLHTVDDLARIPFTQLPGDYFKFVLPTLKAGEDGTTASLTAVDRAVADRRKQIFRETGIIGLTARERALPFFRNFICREEARSWSIYAKSKGWPRVRVGQGYTSTFVAYQEFNHLVAAAFKNLANRERRAWDTVRSTGR